MNVGHGNIRVGDTILYCRKKKIQEWEINKIGPTGYYLEIENDDWSARWIHLRDVHEILESKDVIEVTPERPAVIESKFK